MANRFVEWYGTLPNGTNGPAAVFGFPSGGSIQISQTGDTATAFIQTLPLATGTYALLSGINQTWGNTQDFTAATINVATQAFGDNTTKAASTAFVKTAFSALSAIHFPCMVASQSNININAPGASIDGISLNINDRVLLVGQALGSENGPWLWQGAAVPMMRPADFTNGATTLAVYDEGFDVKYGTLNGGTFWLISTTGTITIGTTPITFVKFSWNLSDDFVQNILGVNHGGTGGSSHGAGRILYGNGTGPLGSSSNFTFNGTNLVSVVGTYDSSAGVITANAPALNASQTWNNGAVAFNGLFLNITNTASAAASRLANLQVGGVTVFSVTLDGSGLFSGRINLSPIAPPSNNGDVWTDSTQRSLGTYQNNLGGFIPQTFYVCTADTTVTNTTTPTSIIGTGLGTKTIPANWAAIGKQLVIDFDGIISDTGTPNLTFDIRLGATVIATGTNALGAGLSNAKFVGRVMLTFRTVGVSGTVIAGGMVTISSGGAATSIPLVATGTTIINTTTTQLVDIFATWGTASASNTLIRQQARYMTSY